MKIINYIQNAKNNEVIFRLILDEFGVKHTDLSVDEIYTKFSDGNRYGIWTILNFEEKEENLFEFSCESVATMSGYSRSDLWSVKNDKMTRVSNISFRRY